LSFFIVKKQFFVLHEKTSPNEVNQIKYNCISELSNPGALPRGGFGLVIFYREDGGKEIAIKFINLTKFKLLVKHSVVTKAIEEVTLLKQLNTKLKKDCNDKIINFIGSKKMTITNKSEKQHYSNYNLLEAKRMMCQITFAIKCLHSLGVVYNDLKPANVLINNDKTCRLTDFNCIVKKSEEHLPESKQKFTGCSTPDFRSPEQVYTGFSYDFKADIWQLGILFICILKKDPMSFISKHALVKKVDTEFIITHINMYNYYILHDEIDTVIQRFKDINTEKQALSELIFGVLELDPRKRWNIDQILSCEFLECIHKEEERKKS
jgi:serine/threonine protein kinase